MGLGSGVLTGRFEGGLGRIRITVRTLLIQALLQAAGLVAAHADDVLQRITLRRRPGSFLHTEQETGWRRGHSRSNKDGDSSQGRNESKLHLLCEEEKEKGFDLQNGLSC